MQTARPARHGVTEVFLTALRLGLTSFGGPVAHIGYFRDEYVNRRRWLDETSFGELVAITNLLPGPSSSQLGIAIGTLRAGKLGGLAAWLGFTLPSALVMLAFARGVRGVDVEGAGWLHGLELAAAAVVLWALIAMIRSLAPDAPRLAIAAAAAATALVWEGPLGQVVPILAAGVIGAVAMRGGDEPELHLRFPVSPRLAVAALVAFAVLLAGLPVLRDTGGHAVALVDAFYRSGALVFGGGHVVLPLLNEEVVRSGWVSEQEFLAGYGAAQALPGPLFTFSAYLGAVETPEPNGVAGGTIGLAAIFLPSFLLLAGMLPTWSSFRERPLVRAAVKGVGAAVVGLLAAAFWDPILTSGVDGAGDIAFATLLFLLLLRRLPPWAVVGTAAALGALVF